MPTYTELLRLVQKCALGLPDGREIANRLAEQSSEEILEEIAAARPLIRPWNTWDHYVRLCWLELRCRDTLTL